MKSLALKLSLGIMSVFSVVFGAVRGDAVPLMAAGSTSVAPSSNPYGDYPFSLGMFDVVTSSGVTYQTGYYKFSVDDLVAGASYQNCFETYVDHDFSDAYQSGNRGVGYASDGLAWMDANASLSSLPSGWWAGFGGAYARFLVCAPLSVASSLSSVQSYLRTNYGDEIVLQYKLAVPVASNVPLDEVLRYPTLDEIYAAGYNDGYNNAVETDFDQKTGVYIQWDTAVSSNRTFEVSVYDGASLISRQTLSYYNATVYFERPTSKVYKFIVMADDHNPFAVTYSSRDYPNDYQILNDSMAYNGLYYLPTWEGGITLTINAGVSSSVDLPSVYGFVLDADMASHVAVSSTYAAGYRAGYLDGQNAVQNAIWQSGYSDGRSDGYSNGYGDGRSVGYAEGYSYAADHNVGSPVMLNVWSLMSAVISMPFSFFQNGLDWTLFEGSPYEFSVSIFFGSLFVLLMMWKIVQLIWRFGK